MVVRIKRVSIKQRAKPAVLGVVASVLAVVCKRMQQLPTMLDLPCIVGRIQPIRVFSIYTLSDLDDLSNLIGSLSRTIQQDSPPSEWITCELGFSHFRERSFKSRQNPRVDFFLGKKRLWTIQSFVVDGLFLQFLSISVEEAVSWTQRFLTRKIRPRNQSLFMTNKSESKCLQKFYVSSK